MSVEQLPLFDEFYLSPIERSDSERIIWAMNNEELDRTMLGPPVLPYEEKHAIKFLDAVEAARKESGIPYYWAIRDKSKQGLFIGSIAIRSSEIEPAETSQNAHIPRAKLNIPHKYATFGFYLVPDYQNRGLMTKALDVILHKIGYDIMGIKTFYGSSFANNWASRRTFEKVGFEYVEEQIGAVKKRRSGELIDIWIYELYLD